MSRVKMLNILLCCMFINACSLLDPFVDRRREAGVKDISKLYVGESKPDRPAICYNTLTTNIEEVQRLADEECIKQKTGTRAVMEKETVLSCRLLLPNHMYFKCVD